MAAEFTVRACSRCGTVIDHDSTGGTPEHLCAARQRELHRAELAAASKDQGSRNPGDPILHVVKSHKWLWKPRFAWRGLGNTITLQWLWFHARYWRG